MKERKRKMIDLHLHTNHSDGTDSVEELLKNAQKNNLEVISITDHDSVEAYFELEEKPELRKLYAGKIIVGTELRAVYQKTNIEILGYGVDPHQLKITTIDQFQIQQEMLAYFKQVAQNLGIRYEEKIQVKKDDPRCFYASHTFARSILIFQENIPIFEKMGLMFEETAFYRIHESNPVSPFYYDNSKYYPTLEQVVKDIHQAGGIAFLAHGYVYPFTNQKQTIQEILEKTAIDGAECEYPLFSKEQREEIKKLCRQAKKLQSGGSDYHAKNKPNIQMGTGIENNLSIPREMIAEWENQVLSI